MEMIEDLEKVSIYQLRNIARRIGVFRPTTLTKAKLISEMTDIMTQNGYHLQKVEMIEKNYI